jgi:hypothetical protein
MPRPPRLDWGQYRSQITEQYESGASHDTILHNLATTTGVTITRQHLLRLLRSWGVSARRQRLQVTDELIERIKHSFFALALNDKEIVQDLEQDGIHVSKVKYFSRTSYNLTIDNILRSLVGNLPKLVFALDFTDGITQLGLKLQLLKSESSLKGNVRLPT